MTVPNRILGLFVAAGLLAGAAAGAAAPEREARIARELQAVVRTGEALLLRVPEPQPAPEEGQAATGAGTPDAPEAASAPPGQEGQEEEAEEPIPVPDGLAVDEQAAQEPAAPQPESSGEDDEPAAEAPPEPANDGPQALALYLPPDGRTERGGAVLLHDLGGHPDWPEVIGPLRRRLPDDGWATLAVQMPLPAPGSGAVAPLLEEAVPRVQAAVAELRRRGHQPVVLIGHGTGAAMAAAYLQEKADPAVAAGVVISLGVPGQGGAGFDPAASLEGAELPVLAIHGSEAPRYVLDTVAKLDGERVTRFTTLGTGHTFDGAQTALLGRIRGWLRRALEPAEGESG